MSKSSVVILSSSLLLLCEFVELSPTYLVWFVYLFSKGVGGGNFFTISIPLLKSSLIHWLKTKKPERNVQGSNAGTSLGDGRVHIQDNPSATCAMKIRPLCRGNVIVYVPSSNCALKSPVRCLRYAVLSQDLLILLKKIKVTGYLGYSLHWSPHVGGYIFFNSSLAMFGTVSYPSKAWHCWFVKVYLYSTESSSLSSVLCKSGTTVKRSVGFRQPWMPPNPPAAASCHHSHCFCNWVTLL